MTWFKPTAQGGFNLISSGLEARYNFEDTGDTTTATDSAGTNDVSLSGPTYTTTSQIDANALQFDGIDDTASLSTGFTDIGNNFTVTVWAYFTSTPYSFDILTINGNQGIKREYKVILQENGNGNIRANIGDGNSAYKAGGLSPSTNTWYHFAGTYDGSTLRFYVDGSQTDTNSVSITTYTTDELYHGYGVDGSGVSTGYLPGILDDVRYYSEVKTASEIQTIANGNG